MEMVWPVIFYVSGSRKHYVVTGEEVFNTFITEGLIKLSTLNATRPTCPARWFPFWCFWAVPNWKIKLTRLFRNIWSHCETQDCVNKITLGSGGRARNQVTGISHREYRGARKTDADTHRKEYGGTWSFVICFDLEQLKRYSFPAKKVFASTPDTRIFIGK